MKKLLFTLFLSLLTLTMSAQIQRTFLGNTLGESTYAQVKANMAKKDMKFPIPEIKIGQSFIMSILLATIVNKLISTFLMTNFVLFLLSCKNHICKII